MVVPLVLHTTEPWLVKSPMVPSYLWATVYPRVDFDDPPPLEPGMIGMLLDPRGRLVQLSAVAPEEEEDAGLDVLEHGVPAYANFVTTTSEHRA